MRGWRWSFLVILVVIPSSTVVATLVDYTPCIKTICAHLPEGMNPEDVLISSSITATQRPCRNLLTPIVHYTPPLLV